ncbi:MAG: primosomal protein N' [Acidobacteriota bacterium]
MSQPTSTQGPFLEVALSLPISRNFYYQSDPQRWGHLLPGQRVLVPFQNRKLTGFVVKTLEQLPPDFPKETVRQVIDLLDEMPLISEDLFRLSEWAADYYFAGLGEVLKACLPPKSHVQSRRQVQITLAGLDACAHPDQLGALSAEARNMLYRLAERRVLKWSQITREGTISCRAAEKLVRLGWAESRQKLAHAAGQRTQLSVALTASIQERTALESLTDAQLRVLAALTSNESPVLAADLQKQCRVSLSTLRVLERKGVVRLTEQSISRDPFLALPAHEGPAIRSLTTEQEEALRLIRNHSTRLEYFPVLLHGVTGSGKTEIYLNLIEEKLRQGQDSLILMPEIGLTPRIAAEFRARLGETVAILHSALGEGERRDEWWRIRSGQAKVAVGTRSAIFAPLSNLGLIIVDEEHDPSYKQQERPRYHARDLALVLGKMRKAVVVLGSATPAIETCYNAHEGKYSLAQLSQRVHSRPLPSVKLVDMRLDFQESSRHSILSQELRQAIQVRLERKEQVLILLNRRGFSAFVLCRSCGETFQCRNCSISLAYHRGKNCLLCHYCGFQQKPPKQCGRCGSEYLYYLGEGTEKVETLFSKAFPQARIARLDRDTASRKNAHSRILHEVQSGQVDILVGTQMISKGHDFPNVTLVGVLLADHSLSLPDFRSAERTYQLLSQMSGRAGRGQLAGEVLIQTFAPEHYCLKFVAQHDYKGFYQKELRFRQFMHYPPFASLACILVRDRNLDEALRIVQALGQIVDQQTDTTFRVLGPTQSPLARLKQQYRFQILIKSKSRSKLREILKRSLKEGEARGIDLRKVSVDIDPVSVM